MVCIDDVSPLIAAQSAFTLIYLPLRLMVQWSVTMIAVWDLVAKILIAMKFAFVTRALIETLAVGLWPSNIGSQVWLLLFATIFYHSVVQMLMTSTMETGFAIVSFFCGLSFLTPVWNSYQLLIGQMFKHLFGIEIKLIGSMIVAIAIILIIAGLILTIYWKGWINTMLMSVLIIIDVVISSHIVIYNVNWSMSSLFMSTDMCCEFIDVMSRSIHSSGSQCPLRFTWVDVIIAGVAIFLITPLEFFRREQCVPMWFCCRRRARSLERYRRQHDQPYYGIALDEPVSLPVHVQPKRKVDPMVDQE